MEKKAKGKAKKKPVNAKGNAKAKPNKGGGGSKGKADVDTHVEDGKISVCGYVPAACRCPRPPGLSHHRSPDVPSGRDRVCRLVCCVPSSRSLTCASS